MRKQITGPDQIDGPRPDGTTWLDLEPLARVELTSEEPAHPIEAALRGEPGPGWRAATPGAQSISLFFDAPQPLSRVRLVFEEQVTQRTQEFVLRWSPDQGRTFHEIVRQQYNFSPPGATREIEEYRVELVGVTVLTLQITPEISGGEARASLAALQLA